MVQDDKDVVELAKEAAINFGISYEDAYYRVRQFIDAFSQSLKLNIEEQINVNCENNNPIKMKR